MFEAASGPNLNGPFRRVAHASWGNPVYNDDMATRMTEPIHRHHGLLDMGYLLKKGRPTGLDDLAAFAAADHGDKGGIVITLGAGGVRIGASGLTPDELRKALCTAIHYTYVQENAYEFLDMDGPDAVSPAARRRDQQG